MIIISGGQIGVDRAALDAAIDHGFVDPNFMGWCTRGRRAKDGRIPDKYIMKEHTSPHYPARTEANILAADTTLVLGWGQPTGGTALTLNLCRTHGSRHAFIDLAKARANSEKNTASWLEATGARIVNVAGPSREDVYETAYRFVWYVLEAL